MSSLECQVLNTAHQWLAQGRHVVLVVVVQTWGSSPRPPGALMIIRDDGQVLGSVSGGCIEDDLIDRMRQGVWRHGGPQALMYGGEGDDAIRWGLPCGGRVHVVMEPLGADSLLGPWQDALRHRQLVQRCLDMRTGQVQLSVLPSGEVHAPVLEGHSLITRHGPDLRLLIIGGGQLSQCLARMAQMLDYEVTVCDPREQYRSAWADQPPVHWCSDMPDDVVNAMQMDGRTAVVALSHDPKLDDLALIDALKSPAFYVGALGSRRHQAARRARLAQFDLSPAQTQALRGPVGLNLGGRTPPEIALAILADMTATLHGRAHDLSDWASSGSAGCSGPG